jgi:hypothetical protein
LCPTLERESGFESLASYLLTRGLADSQYKMTWQKDNVCGVGP